jgi:hypothetical protein
LKTALPFDKKMLKIFFKFSVLVKNPLKNSARSIVKHVTEHSFLTNPRMLARISQSLLKKKLLAKAIKWFENRLKMTPDAVARFDKSSVTYETET